MARLAASCMASGEVLVSPWLAKKPPAPPPKANLPPSLSLLPYWKLVCTAPMPNSFAVCWYCACSLSTRSFAPAVLLKNEAPLVPFSASEPSGL